MMKALLKKIRNSNVFRRAKTLRSLCKSLFWFGFRILTSKRGVKINVGDTGRIRLDCRFTFSNYETWGQRHNDGFQKLIELCRGKHTVLDVGAHIGLCALPVSKVIREDGAIFAFEPGAANFSYLQKHIRYNRIQNVYPFPLLVGEVSRDQVGFYESPTPTGMNSVVQYKDLESADWILKEQVCLDHFCNQHGIVPDVIKIDVEGAEIGVLKGARQILTMCRPTLMLSVHPRHLKLQGESGDNLRQIIHELDYSISDMSGNDVKTFELKEYLLEPIHKPS